MEKSSNLITIDLYCRENRGTYRVEVLDKLDKIPEEEAIKYKLVRFFMRPMTWKLHTDLIRSATFLKHIKSMGGKGKGRHVEEIDWSVYRQNKAILAIEAWNLVDDNGDKIEVDEEKILSMHPDVMERLIDKYDEVSLISKEKEKNLILKTFKYYQSVYGGSGSVEAPPEVVELSLMEKFNWTPQQISEIPYAKIQELFIILNQRDKTQSDSNNTKQFIATGEQKKKT